MSLMVQVKNLIYDYLIEKNENEEPERHRAIDDLTLEVNQGEFIAVLGRNGSGKSTFAKQINGLLKPTSGTLTVCGMDTAEEKNLLAIRQKAGMVFQNPDNQIIASIVEEDVGFGPENIGVPTEEIWKRVEKSLSQVGMLKYRKHSPNRLSGGQKQRIAIAGVMAMKPDCIILDEPTAMLDPSGRRDVIDTVRELQQKEHVTVILITHYMDEVVHADKVFVMDHGHLAMQGTPREVFSQAERLRELGLSVPQVTELAQELKAAGWDLPDCVLTTEELREELIRLWQ